jgi:membrane protease subunit (stomatin/prohibitin family)
MTTYTIDQEIKDVLWGTPMPIAVNIDSEMVLIHVKGACSLVVKDADLLQEKLPDSRSLASHVRSTLVMAATDAVGQMRQKISSVEQLVKFTPEFSMLLKVKAAEGMAAVGLKISELEIHSIQRVDPASL